MIDILTLIEFDFKIFIFSLDIFFLDILILGIFKWFNKF
jgi:hypothetical protein